jgi:glycosyltransferase involved in cell wall biosynthesis
MPSLTVSLTNYNHSRYLEGALEAIATQSRVPDQFIVIDDASTDNSAEIIKAFAARYSFIQPILNEKNRGVIANINRGLEIATGDYVFLAAADDLVLPGLFEKAMKLAEENPEAGCICCDPVWRAGDDGEMWVTPLPLGKHAGYFSGPEIAVLHQSRRIPIVGHATLYRRACVFDAGCFIPELKGLTDWLLIVVIAFRNGMCYLPEALSLARLFPDSYSGKQSRSWTEQRDMLQSLMDVLDRPAYADLRGAIIESEVLAGLGADFARFARESRSVAPFLTAGLRRKLLIASFQRNVSTTLPPSIRKGLKKAWSRARTFQTS